MVGGVGIARRRGRRRVVRKKKKGDAIVVVRGGVGGVEGMIAIAGEEKKQKFCMVGLRFVPRYLDLHRVSLGWDCGMWLTMDYRVWCE